MKALLVTAGSRGDVEPFAALARRLSTAGHEVVLALPDNSGANLQGVSTASLGVDFTRMIEDQGVSPLKAMRNLKTVVRPVMRGVIVGAAEIAKETRPDVVLAHPKVASASLIAGALDIPLVLVEIVPVMTATSEFAAAGTVTANLGPLNRLTYAAAGAAAGMFRGELDAAAAVMGVRRGKTPPPAATLMPISPALLDRPHDWPASLHLTGAWIDSTAAPHAPDDELDAFLAGGPAVYAGFGSMAAGDPQARGRALVAAVRERGERMLVATGLGGIDIPADLRGDDILVRRSVDHAHVLPRVQTAIHHGGIGTVHAAVRAGAVSLIVPFIADQPFWGARLHHQGLGPAPVPAKRATASRIAEALDDADSYRDAVSMASARMRDEDGTAAAVRVLESVV